MGLLSLLTCRNTSRSHLHDSHSASVIPRGVTALRSGARMTSSGTQPPSRTRAHARCAGHPGACRSGEDIYLSLWCDPPRHTRATSMSGTGEIVAGPIRRANLPRRSTTAGVVVIIARRRAPQIDDVDGETRPAEPP